MSGTLHLAKRYDTFIFDWDGTLTTTKLLRKLNEKLNPHWLYKKKKSTQMIDRYSISMPKNLNTLKAKVIRRHIRNVALENELISPLADISVYFIRPKLHNDVRRLLEILRKKRISIALFTNGAPYRVVKELSYLGIEDYFSAIASAQSLGALKPNPLGLNAIINSLGARKRSTIYVGDMVNDIEAAKYAGIDSCALSSGFDSYKRLRSASPKYLFGSVEQLMGAL